MYEVAPVATESSNPFEAKSNICALPIVKEIMGQITSNHQQATPVSRHHSERKSKIYYRHSAVQPLRKEDLAILRDPIKNASIYRGSTRESSIRRVKDTSMPNGRPVTISEMNAYNIEKNDTSSVKSSNREILKCDADPTASTGSTTTKTATGTTAASKRSTLPNEFYNTVGDGYHKTDNCYYRSPDGGYHKLPSDSYHKMSEGCYVKTGDGSFRRLETASTNPNGSDSHSQNSGQTKVKSQVMKFLKRSKSHTPATLKELQKEKENRSNNSGATGGTSGAGEKNRKVVVTMMENGGLPIVATSKADRSSKHTRDKDGSSGRNKVSKILKLFLEKFIYKYCLKKMPINANIFST